MGVHCALLYQLLTFYEQYGCFKFRSLIEKCEKGQKYPQSCEFDIKHVVLYVGHLYKPFWTKKFDRVGRRGQGRSKYGTFGSFQWEMCTNALFWPSLTPPANPVKFFWSKMAFTGVPRIVLHVSCRTRTSGGYFWPSEVRFRGILALFERLIL